MADAAGSTLETVEILELMKLLPHRYPFLMIDRIVEIDGDDSAVGVKNVTINEPHFQGHFPDQPVMPGVLIVEALGQTGAVLMSKSLDADVSGKAIFFMSVDGARFRKPVRPGDQLRMKVVVVKHRGDLFKFRGEAFVDGKLVAEAEFAAMVVETGL